MSQVLWPFHPAAAAGERITPVLVGDQPLDLAGQYAVVVNSFLASGGDNFTTLAQGSNPRDSGRVDLQAFVDYMAEFSPVSPDLAQRAVGVRVVVPEGGFLPGDTVTADLSSVLFSGTEQQDAQVVVSVGGTQVGSFPIDPTDVPTTDEVGRATVTFAVPADAPGGDLQVVVTVPSTGTTASFAIPAAEVAGPACTVDYQAIRLWPRSMLGLVTVANTGTDPVADWELAWQFTNRERATFGLGATVRQRGSAVTATNAWWSSTLDPAESATFAFFGIASRGVGTPSGFMLNGVECTVG